jgi:protein-S-isoprenylcysteine O-methyltransferase Ste14
MTGNAKLSRVLTRLRVPLGWVLGIGAVALARPTVVSYAAGLVIAAIGEVVRVWAAGHLHKWKGITRSGPYAWTRNPLYLGSFLVGLGFAVATARWEVGLLLVVLIAGVYIPVMKSEAARLAEQHPETYPEYARKVPLLIPRALTRETRSEQRRFSWPRVRENREHVTVVGWLVGAALLWWRMG